MPQKKREPKNTPVASAAAAEAPETAARKPPNARDPLSEPSRHRRIWAAYMQRGYSRASWARALGAQYTSADRWDTGEVTMGLDTFMKACELLGYSPAELHYGKQGPPPAPAGEDPVAPAASAAPQPYVQRATLVTEPSGADPELDDAAVRQLLRELRAEPEERTALAQLVNGPGKYDVVTETYVREFVTAHAEMRARGVPPAARQLQAHNQALRVQAQGRLLASPPAPPRRR